MNRAAPIGVKYWEIGNELNGNGYFGTGLNWQTDLHSTAVGAARQNDPNLSPAFYGQHVVQFAAAMKAVDPTIKIGAVLDNASNYDPFVLEAAAPAMDFGIVHYYPSLSQSGSTANRATQATNFLAASDRRSEYDQQRAKYSSMSTPLLMRAIFPSSSPNLATWAQPFLAWAKAYRRSSTIADFYRAA